MERKGTTCSAIRRAVVVAVAPHKPSYNFNAWLQKDEKGEWREAFREADQEPKRNQELVVCFGEG
eukprot:scaffold251_cov78-Skeletonema_dohrnii-CCMP3373.AAC.1